MKNFLLILTIAAIIIPMTGNAAVIDNSRGMILLQVEERGEAWYVNPTDDKKYYMKDGTVAYSMMRSFGLGITDQDLQKIPSVSNTTEMNEATSICSSNFTANRLKGQILLQVEQHGEAWYIYPKTCQRIYMKDGDAAYQIMRYLGLGITNAHLAQLITGNILVSAQFENCVKTGKYDELIEFHMTLGEALGVSGTPTMIIGDDVIAGYRTYPQLEQIIKEYKNLYPNKPIEIAAFMDFECPYCVRLYFALQLLLINYPDVSLEVPNFPLSFHSNAMNAARAFECANENGKKWEMYDKLFELSNGGKLNYDNIMNAAGELGL